MKKIHIKTYGCQMNVYDSERMAEAMAPQGYVQTGDAAAADVVILNTCHIREKAAEKVYSDIGRLRDLRQERRQAGGKDMLIGVGGCVAQAEGAEMLRRAPAVDLVFGPQTYHRLPVLVEAALAERQTTGQAQVIDTDFPAEDKFDHLPATRAHGAAAAFLTIQEGCDKFCTFCVVPYTRGAEVSRPAAKIIAEAERLIAQGVVEITLLGQNVNGYHGQGEDGAVWGLGRLLRRLAAIPGLARLRYTTSHPRDMDDDLIAAHGELDSLMPYLHLPVQSGADRILLAMNRGHDAADYLRLVDRLRRARPDLAFSSDFIVGFPGESEADFAATLALAREVGYAQAYSFKYSARPGTPAAEMATQIAEEVKAERLALLQAEIAASQWRFNQATVGRRMAVLLERPGRTAGQLVGRSPYMQAVHVDAGPASAGLLGTIADVEIVSAGPHSVAARLGDDSRRTAA